MAWKYKRNRNQASIASVEGPLPREIVQVATTAPQKKRPGIIWTNQRVMQDFPAPPMKVFRVVLHSFGPTYIEADSCVQDTSIRFYRGGQLLAEYLSSTVKSVEETKMPVQRGLFETPPTEETNTEDDNHKDDGFGSERDADGVRG